MASFDLARLAARDPGEWRRVLDAWRPRIFGYLVRLSGRRDVAEDLTQLTFTRLAANAGRLLPDTELGAWLFRVAHNALISDARASRAAAALAAEWIDGQPTTAPALTAEFAGVTRRIEAAIAALSPPLRAVFVLCVVEGRAAPDVASILNLSHDNVRARLSRARAQLAVALADLRPTEPSSQTKEPPHAR